MYQTRILKDSLAPCGKRLITWELTYPRFVHAELMTHVELHDRLCSGPATGEPGHWSPFEHVAMALAEARQSGNFSGWAQYRKEFEHEHYGARLL
jgi:hypothetical protein